MDEQLRLGASFEDKASPRVRALKKEIAEIRSTPGMQAVAGWMTSFSKEAEGAISKGFGAAGMINAMGIGGLTAAASIGTLIEKMKELKDRDLALKEISRQIGMTRDELNAFAHAGAHFRVGDDAMTKMAEHWAAQMPEFMRNSGAAYRELSRWPPLIEKLKHEGTKDQLTDLFKFIGDNPQLIAEPQLQKQVAGALFGDAESAEKIVSERFAGLKRQWDLATKQMTPISWDLLLQEGKFNDAVESLSRQIENLEHKAGEPFFKVMTGWVQGIEVQVKMFQGDVDRLINFFHPNRDATAKKQREGGAKDEQDRERGGLSLDDPRIQEALRKKTAFNGGGGLLHMASFGDAAPASSSDIVSTLAEGTRQGFLAAMRDLMTTNGDASGAAPSGLIRASLETGAAGYGGSGRGGTGYEGGSGLGSAVTTVDKTLPKEARAFLDAIAAGEAKDYNVMNGGGTFSDYSHHPGGRAAGRYQDLPSTWRRISGALGLHDFSPESQDKGNWWLAQQDYRSRTHRDLLSDLRSGNPGVIASIGRALHSTWVSTNGTFAGRYAGALGRGEAGGIGLNLHTLNEECVSLAKAAVGAAGSVHDWRRGVNALDGSMKPGTPIATFLDSMGHLSNRYAGGGNGTPGAGRDHAAIFRSYIRDKAGNIIGMSVAEQSRGRPPHLHDYMRGGGYGEHDASNYFGIKGTDGSYLGGDRNPMNRRATGLPNPAAEASRAARVDGQIRADIHLHGSHERATVKSAGPIEASLHTHWPNAYRDIAI